MGRFEGERGSAPSRDRLHRSAQRLKGGQLAAAAQHLAAALQRAVGGQQGGGAGSSRERRHDAVEPRETSSARVKRANVIDVTNVCRA